MYVTFQLRVDSELLVEERRRFIINSHRKVAICIGTGLAFGAVLSLIALYFQVPFLIGAVVGFMIGVYLATQGLYDTPSNRELNRAQRGQLDETASSEVNGGRHRSSGDFPPHGF